MCRDISAFEDFKSAFTDLSAFDTTLYIIDKRNLHLKIYQTKSAKKREHAPPASADFCL